MTLKLLGATTIAIGHGTNIMRSSAIFVQEPFQDMHSMTPMPTSLTDNDGIVKRIYQEKISGEQGGKKILHTPTGRVPKVDLTSSIMNNRQSHQTN